MEHPTSFGHWLRLRRERVHVQRAELADRVGCAVVTLRKIEADERRPSRQVAELLAKQLGIPHDERDLFVRVARGELPVDQLPLLPPTRTSFTNLPAPTTSLVGREQEIAAVSALVERADVRLLTLLGAPGVGKTRLGLEAAARMANDAADGVFFVDLAPLTGAELVPVAIAQSLRVDAVNGQLLLQRLRDYLRARQMLLVLDNFEHVLEAAPLLTQLLATAPQLTLLVTSRVALGVAGEHRFTLSPFSLPPVANNGQHPLSAADLQARYAAIELFAQRAQAVAPTFALTDANVREVSDICRCVDGLPLAIEFVAARVPLFTPRELLQQLHDRFALLASPPHDVPAGHSVMGPALDWSYGLLSPPQQRLLWRLGVFVGGCSIEAAQEVCNGDGAVSADVIDGLAVLVSSSLLQRDEGCDGHSRFWLLETVRAYALHHLAAQGEADCIRRRHAAYYLHMAEAAEQGHDRADEWARVRQLVSFRDNLRAALHFAIDTRDAVLALHLNGALFSFWVTGSTVCEARDWLAAALALPRPDDAPETIALEAKVLNIAGYVTMDALDFDGAHAYFDRGLALSRALGDLRGSALSLRGRALVQIGEKSYAAAERDANGSLRLCQASDDAWGEAWSLYVLAFLCLARRDLSRAQQALEDALVDLRRQGVPFGIYRTLLALGYTRFEQGDIVGAEAHYREALAFIQEVPTLTLMTVGLEELAIIAAERLLPLRAARLWGAAEALREATGERCWYPFQHDKGCWLAAARMQVSEADWATAWAAGRALSAEMAIAEALADVGNTRCVSA